MKKILALLLAILFFIPTLPVCAAERTIVDVDTYNNISEKLIVNISASEGFLGATIKVNNEITYTVEESGAGIHTAKIDLDSLSKSGLVSLEVLANYSDGTDTIVKNIVVSKMKTTVLNYTYETMNNKRELNAGTNTFESINDLGTELKLSFSDHSLQSNNKRVDIRIGATTTQNTNANPSGAIYTFEGEMLFKNDENDTTKEKPNIYLDFRARQDSALSVSSGYPTNSLNGESVTDDAYGLFFSKDGKLLDGSPYYTNVWYKFRFVFDLKTQNPDGTLVGGVKTYVAENPGDGYGSFKLLKEVPYLVFNNIQQWRWEPTATAASSLTMKNFKLIKEELIDSWYLKSSEYADGKLNLVFSEDMGTLSSENVKVLNENGDIIILSSISASGDGVYELVPEKNLNSGRNYEILIANSTLSSAGNVALKEPQTDVNGDGMWKLITLKTPAYPLNIASVDDNGTNVVVTFNGSDIWGKYASVCWYDASRALIDFKTLAVDDISKTFTRKNSVPANLIEVYVFGLDGVNIDVCDTKYLENRVPINEK